MASNKKPFALRISPELLETLEKWAEDEFRSVNGQMEYLLSQAVRMRKRGIKVKPDNASDKTDHEH